MQVYDTSQMSLFDLLSLIAASDLSPGCILAGLSNDSARFSESLSQHEKKSGTSALEPMEEKIKLLKIKIVESKMAHL